MKNKINETQTNLSPIKVTFLTQAELAQEIGVCRITISRWTKSGAIPSIRINNRTVRYDLEAVRDFLLDRATKLQTVK